MKYMKMLKIHRYKALYSLFSNLIILYVIKLYYLI